MLSISATQMVAANPDQVHSAMGEDVVILSMAKGAYYSLNPVGALVWKHIQTPVSTLALRDAILNEFEVDIQTCERDLLAVLNDMKRNGLLELA